MFELFRSDLLVVFPFRRLEAGSCHTIAKGRSYKARVAETMGSMQVAV